MLQALRVPEPPVQSTVTRLIKCSQTNIDKTTYTGAPGNTLTRGNPQAAEGFYNSATEVLLVNCRVIFFVHGWILAGNFGNLAQIYYSM